MSVSRNTLTFSQSKSKKFRPPLKSTAPTTASPLLSSTVPSGSLQNEDKSSQGDLCLSDSLPASQTHTVLSYCDNYQEELSTKHSLSPEPGSPASEDSSLLTTDSESEPEELVSRFKPHRPAAFPGYGYNILQQRKRTVADVERGVGRTKRVHIVSPIAKNVGGGRDLSVYDYQPTPPESVAGAEQRDKRRKKNVSSGYCPSREEQLAIDREVIELIKRTRQELQVIREQYAIRARRPLHSSLTPQPREVRRVVRKPLPLVFTSELTPREE